MKLNNKKIYLQIKNFIDINIIKELFNKNDIQRNKK